MANYYTYGAIPNAEETVFGPLQTFQEGGLTIGERNPVTPMPGTKSEEAPLEQISKEVSKSKAPGSAIQDWAKKLQERGQKISLLPDLVTPGLGNLEEEPEEVQTLSSLLQQNKFAEAFSYAQENNLHRYLLDNEKLKNLRTPFTRQEAEEFMYAAPKEFFVSAGELANKQSGKTSSRSFDELYNFDPKKAIESLGALAWVQPGEGGWSMSETGYPLLGRALEPKELKKEPNWFDNLIKGVVTAGTAAALAYVGGTALLGSSGAAGTAGTAGAAGAGGGGALSGISSAFRSILAIPETIGIKIGEALGLETLSTLQAKMIGNAVISGGVTGAKGGDLGDILKSAAISAGFTYVSDKAIKAVTKAVQDSGLLDSASKAGEAIQGGVEAIDDTAASNIAKSVVDNLDQVNIITNTGGALADAAMTLTSVAASQPSVTEPEVKVEATRDQVEPPVTVVEPPLSQEPPVEEPTPPEEEVTIETEREPEVTVPVVTPPTSPIEEVVPVEEEVIVETNREPEVTVPVVTPPTSPIEEAFPTEEVTIETEREPDVVTPPVTPPFPEGPIEEVTVETEREPDVVTPPVTPPFPEGPIEEVTVETEREPEVTPPVVITPPEGPVDADAEKDKGGLPISWQDLLKLIGMIGSATSKQPTAPTGGITTGGLGSALPKYSYTREQLSPDIDYYNYGTRPEAKFFEGQFQLAEPTQPAGPDTGTIPLEDQPVFAQGGLTGYAQGGSKAPRYVDGPGSGRDDKIPALLSDGEYVIDAETLALLGDGSTKEGARRMDQFRANIRKHKGSALSRGRISPNAKSPEKYMGGGLI
jgi:hypothetical protein